METDRLYKGAIMRQIYSGDAAGATVGQGDPATPLEGFSRCHEGIINVVDALATLPGLVTAALRARTVASDVLTTFEQVVLAHHKDEEIELFPAVLRWAAKGEERDRVEGLVQKLTAEHRSIERLWRAHRPAVEAAARGKAVELDEESVSGLVRAYRVHAAFEEQQFLPLAQEVLGRDSAHLASLGMSLHMRHAPHIQGYI